MIDNYTAGYGMFVELIGGTLLGYFIKEVGVLSTLWRIINHGMQSKE